MDIYKPSAKLPLRDESTQVEQWLQAIDGVLVKPTDDIDTNKEYQLIALPAE